MNTLPEPRFSTMIARWRLFLLLTPLLIAPNFALAQAHLAFTHVQIIDGTGAPAASDKTVVIADRRITAIGDAATVRVPDGARVVDASGKYLIPGLWDMHVHWYDDRYLDLFVANGVTGIRQMFGMPCTLSGGPARGRPIGVLKLAPDTRRRSVQAGDGVSRLATLGTTDRQLSS